MSRRVVVIGAGIGGLSAALELLADGHRVTLCERHDAPGGKMRTLDAGGAPIDSGPTVFTMRWVFESLYQRFGVSLAERLDLMQADCLARHSWPDCSRLDLFADVEASVAAIREFAGRRDAEAYRRFAARSARVFETLDETFMRAEKPGMVGLTLSIGLHRIQRLLETSPFRSLWSELGRVFEDERLRQLFGRYATYCGSSPFASPATLMLIAHAERAGVWYVRGGMQRFAESLAGLFTDNGGDLRLASAVEEIVVRGGRAAGVRLAGGAELDADAVVFNGDVNALSGGLLGQAVTRAVPDRRSEQRSLSALTFSIRGRAQGFPLDYHTVFFGPDYPAEFRSIFDDNRICAEPTVYICAQDRPDGAPPGETERLFLLVNAPPRSLDAQEIDACRERVMKLLAAQGLTIDVDDSVTFAPQDFARRFPGSDGAIYGWPTHGWSGTFRRAGSSGGIPRLYFAGGSVHPGPGIPMVALSGRIAARRVAADLG